MDKDTITFIFYTAFAVFAAAQRIMEIRRYPKLPGKISFPWTLWLMSAAHGLCFAAAPLEWFFTGAGFSLLTVPGAALFSAGLFLRRHAIRALSGFWSLNIEIRAAQPLITDGPYALCRHPNYLAILAEITGYCLFYGAPLSFAAALVMYAPALAVRISLEERVMTQKFGELYEAYRRKTPLLLPLRAAACFCRRRPI